MDGLKARKRVSSPHKARSDRYALTKQSVFVSKTLFFLLSNLTV